MAGELVKQSRIGSEQRKSFDCSVEAPHPAQSQRLLYESIDRHGFQSIEK